MKSAVKGTSEHFEFRSFDDPPKNNSRKTASAMASPNNKLKPASRQPIAQSAKKTVHHKTKSCEVKNLSQFGISRFDPSKIPNLSIDIKGEELETIDLIRTRRHNELLEKQIMDQEWRTVKKEMNKKIKQETETHEFNSTLEKIKLKKVVEKEKKNLEKKARKDKEKEFKAFVEAKKQIMRDSQEKIKQSLADDLEKSLARQKEIQDKKEKQKVEREEKRKSFLENIEAAKKSNENENLRLKREREFEKASQVSGMKELSFRLNSSQKVSLDKTLRLFNN